MKTKNSQKSDLYIETLLHLQSYAIGLHGPTVAYFKTWEAAEEYAKTIGPADIFRVIIVSEYPLNYSDGCTFYDLTRGKLDAYIEPFCYDHKPAAPRKITNSTRKHKRQQRRIQPESINARD